MQFEVTRKQGTERAFSGQYDIHDKGLYRCICCDNALFSSDTKFDSGTGWPSFWAPIAKENVRKSIDTSLGMSRDEISCTECEAHLGHLMRMLGPSGNPKTDNFVEIIKYLQTREGVHLKVEAAAIA